MKTYYIKVYEIAEDRFKDYGGGYSEDDVKEITRGYKLDDFTNDIENITNTHYYTRANGKKMFLVNEE